MPLSIKSERADRLARELAALTGESITDAVVASLEARIASERRRLQARTLSDLTSRFRALPVLDASSPEEILGYDEAGLPR